MSEQANLQTEPEINQFQANLSAYRQLLVSAQQNMQSEYDKAIMTLSGGALGLSLTFLKDIVGTKGIVCFWSIMGAWVCWGLSISFIFASFYTSSVSLSLAIADIDKYTIYLSLGENRWKKVTKSLNIVGGLSFLLGLVFLLVFVYCNHPK